MKKTAAILLSILLLAACAGKNLPGSRDTTSGVTETVSGVSDYFPFSGDVRMLYKGDGNEYAEFETYVDYIGLGAMQVRMINPGTTAVSVYVIEDGALKKVFSRGETYFRHDFTEQRGETEEILIKEPIEKGTAWKLPDGTERSITSVSAEVDVPYGVFSALEITTTGKDFEMKSYYAPGTGLIKSVFIPNGDEASKITSELFAMDFNEPFKQEIKFYYPDFGNDRLVYIERTAELFTGTEMSGIFEEQMRQAPDNELQPLMSKNAVLLGLDFDEENNAVTADFSREFVTEMNAGSGLEGMILSGVIHTLGNYYHTDNVAVKINGGPYESGHYHFDEGEYIDVSRTDVAAFEKQSH